MCQYQIVLHCYTYFAPIWCDNESECPLYVVVALRKLDKW